MDPGVERPSQANQTTANKTPAAVNTSAAVKTIAAMSSDQSTPGDPGVDMESPCDPLEQHSYLPDELPKIIAPIQPKESKLESQPDDLLFMIIGALAPTHLFLNYTKEYQAYIANLHSLCLVSKRMDMFARPALYRDLRLYSNARVVRLSATLLAHPRLTSYIKSILFFPYRPREKEPENRIGTIDLTPLRSLQDPDFAYWTSGRNGDKVWMPKITINELVYNLLFKILSRTPALEALYLRLHCIRRPDSNPGKCLDRLKADTQFRQQVELQHKLLLDFCEGASRPNLPNLKTVGVLGGEEYACKSLPFPFPFQPSPDSPEYREFIWLFRSFLGSPNLQEVCWAQLDRTTNGSTNFWDMPLLFEYRTRGVPLSHDSYWTVSRSVKRIKLEAVDICTADFMAITKGFPSLESLTVEDKHERVSGFNLDGSRIFQFLGNLDNLRTLELDFLHYHLSVRITTESGRFKLVDLSAMSKLRTLVVPLTYFDCSESNDEELQLEGVQRITTLLPGSLRCLTLLLNEVGEIDMLNQIRLKRNAKCWVEEYLQRVVPALLIEYPHLEKIDYCYNMDHYRQNKIQTAALRSAHDATSGVAVS